jgi:DNA-binding IclR family transcriptional regulator
VKLKAEDSGTIKSLRKGIILLKKLLNSDEEISIGELQKEVGFSQSTTHHLLKTLKIEGFVSQNTITKKYTIGPELFNIWLQQNKLYRYFYRSLPVLEDIESRFEETTTLSIRREHEAIVVIGKESHHTLKASLRIGRRIPLYCTAAGKAFLAYLDRETINQIIYRTGLNKYLPNTITLPDKLFEELEAIKQRGVAIELEEFEDMINAVSVPIFNDYNEVVLTLTVIAPITRLNDKKIAAVIPYLKEKANEIEEVFTTTEF